nr:serine hydrolase domain-containing protein [Brachybacterium sp. ACRRE]
MGERARVWEPGAVDDLLAPFSFPCALGVAGTGGTLLTAGDVARVHPLASVSKPIAALGALIAVDRSLLDLEAPVGLDETRGALAGGADAEVPEGATIRHLLAHTAGFAFDTGALLAAPGSRRIYSNTGFEVLGRALEQATGTDLETWLEDEVCGPLGLRDLEASGSPAAGFRASVQDLLLIGREMLAPTLLDPALWREATSVQFPGLPGVLPGYGRQKHNDWGLGLEIRDGKSPHWTGERSGPASFGHFGQSGSFLLLDPDRGLALAFLGDEPFGPSHVEHWPGLIDAVLARHDAGEPGA